MQRDTSAMERDFHAQIEKFMSPVLQRSMQRFRMGLRRESDPFTARTNLSQTASQLAFPDRALVGCGRG